MRLAPVSTFALSLACPELDEVEEKSIAEVAMLTSSKTPSPCRTMNGLPSRL